MGGFGSTFLYGETAEISSTRNSIFPLFICCDNKRSENPFINGVDFSRVRRRGGFLEKGGDDWRIVEEYLSTRQDFSGWMCTCMHVGEKGYRIIRFSWNWYFGGEKLGTEVLLFSIVLVSYIKSICCM